MKFHNRVLITVLMPIVLVTLAGTTRGQSPDQELPTAVLSNQISGRIPALDLGDPRLTRHFYAFEATPGDLLITVNSRNLNGDVDIFTAVSFKPLMKISLYANTIPPEVSKSLYFRTRQILILRVEARTPNDDPGAYRIAFGGTFQAFSGGIPVAEEDESETSQAGDRTGKRLSSVGATVAEPAGEVKAEETKTTDVASEKPPVETIAKKPVPKPRRTRPARGRPARTPPRPPKTETAKTETAGSPSEEKAAGTEENPGEKPATEKPPAQEPGGAHLIIEKTDGAKVDRPMSTVRRVIVEGNVIVIVLKSGRIERIPMSLVVRMAIEP